VAARPLAGGRRASRGRGLAAGHGHRAGGPGAPCRPAARPRAGHGSLRGTWPGCPRPPFPSGPTRDSRWACRSWRPPAASRPCSPSRPSSSSSGRRGA
jgi:hypothetical protein